MSQEIDTLHKPFMKYLRDEKIPYIRARSDKASTIGVGTHDFTLLYGNRALCIEFKDKGSLSSEQKEWIALMESRGTKVHVIRRLEDAIELVLFWLSNQPAAVATEPEQDRSKLRQHQGWVYESDSSCHDSFCRTRKCGPGDAYLPQLFGK